MMNHLGLVHDLSQGFSWAPDQFPIMETDHILLHKQREPKRTHQSKVIKEKLTKLATGGKPSTRLPPGELAEQLAYAQINAGKYWKNT